MPSDDVISRMPPEDETAAPCPYVKRAGDGTAHCELAETGIKVFEKLAKDNEQKALDWQHEFNMYRSAWLRELGGKLIPKAHDIDAFVLTTRALREKAEQAPRIKQLQTELNAALDVVEAAKAAVEMAGVEVPGALLTQTVAPLRAALERWERREPRRSHTWKEPKDE
jgi:hypothetical protein